jgi:hypothetical protein
MRPLSRQQEQQLVDALVPLDWMNTDDRKSCELIREQLGCVVGLLISVPCQSVYRLALARAS